jgi:hypothetical protein
LLFATDEQDFWDWLGDISQLIYRAILLVSLSLVTAGGIIGSAVMLTNEKTMAYGQVTLGVTALFAVGLVVSALRSTPPTKGL